MDRKKAVLIGTILAVLVVFSGCVSNAGNAPSGETPRIVATIYPLYEFSKAVAGEGAQVNLLLPPGAEAHSFEPRPSDIIRIKESNLFVYIGAGMEPWAHDILEGAGAKMALEASSKVTLLRSEEGEGHSHEHEGGEHPFEWVGLFELEQGNYSWSFAKVGGEYADPAMKMVVLKSDDIESVEEQAEGLFESGSGETVFAGGLLLPNQKAYVLSFDESKETTVFRVEITAHGKYAFFTEHMPFEFEAGEHFFKDSSGNDIEPIAQEPEAGHSHSYGEYDPHIWLDFGNDVKIVNAIAQALSENFPENAAEYEKNAREYSQKLSELDAKYRQGLASCKRREFITGGHNAYRYLADSYDLTYLSAYGISPDSEPTPKAISDLIDLAKSKGIKYVLFEELVSPRISQALAEQVGAQTLVLQPVESISKEGISRGETFITSMENNLQTLRIALECE